MAASPEVRIRIVAEDNASDTIKRTSDQTKKVMSDAEVAARASGDAMRDAGAAAESGMNKAESAAKNFAGRLAGLAAFGGLQILAGNIEAVTESAKAGFDNLAGSAVARLDSMSNTLSEQYEEMAGLTVGFVEEAREHLNSLAGTKLFGNVLTQEDADMLMGHVESVIGKFEDIADIAVPYVLEGIDNLTYGLDTWKTEWSDRIDSASAKLESMLPVFQTVAAGAMIFPATAARIETAIAGVVARNQALITNSLGVIAAAGAGWMFGDFLYQNFETARTAGLAMVEGLLKAWEFLKMGAATAANFVIEAFHRMVQAAAQDASDMLHATSQAAFGAGMDTVGQKAMVASVELQKMASAHKKTADTVAADTVKVGQNYDAEIAKIKEITASQREDHAAWAATHKEKVAAAKALRDVKKDDDNDDDDDDNDEADNLNKVADALGKVGTAAKGAKEEVDKLAEQRVQFEEKLAEEAASIYANSGDKFGAMIDKRRSEAEKLGADMVKFSEWEAAQRYQKQVEYEEKLNNELLNLRGESTSSELARLDKEYAEYDKFVKDKQALNEWYEERKSQIAEKAAQKRQAFELDMAKASGNTDAVQSIEMARREADIRSKYKGVASEAEITQLIEAEKNEIILKEEQKRTESIRKLYADMTAGITKDAEGMFVLSGANISKMAGNLLSLASQQGNGNASAGFSQLFSGQVKSGDALGGLASIGSLFSDGAFDSILEGPVGTFIMDAGDAITGGISSLFGSGASGFLSSFGGPLASGVLSLVSGGFSAANIGNVIGSVAGSFLGPIGTVVGGFLGSAIGGLFGGGNAGWGFGITGQTIGWGGKVQDAQTYELERSSGIGPADKVFKAFKENAQVVLDNTYELVGNFLGKLPQQSQDAANAMLKDAQIQIKDIYFSEQNADDVESNESRMKNSIAIIEGKAIEAAIPALNAANQELFKTYDSSLIQAGSGLDTLMQNLQAGFEWKPDMSAVDQWGKGADEAIAAEKARLNEYLAAVGKFQELMALGDSVIAAIDAQLEPMTEYESDMKALNDQLAAADAQLLAIGYSETALTDVRAKSAELAAKEEQKWAYKRAGIIEGAKADYGLDGLTDYERAVKKINDYFDKRTEELKQSGASESQYYEDITELSDLRSQALEKETVAYNESLNAMAAQRAALYEELDRLTGITPDLSSWEQGFNNIIAYGEKLKSAGATDAEISAAADKYIPAYRQTVLTRSGELSGRISTEKTDFQAEVESMNAEFDSLRATMNAANAPINERITLESDHLRAMDKIVKKYEEQRKAIFEDIDALTGMNKSIGLVRGAVKTLRTTSDDAAKALIAAGGTQADLDNLSSKWDSALTENIKNSMFGDVTAQSISNIISSGVNKIFEDAANGIAPNFSSFGADIQKEVNLNIQMSIANTEMGATADLIYDTWINPILTGLAEKAKENGGVLSNEDIAAEYFRGSDPLMQEVANRAAERQQVYDNATKGVYKSAEEMSAALLAVDTKYQAATDFVTQNLQEPVDIEAPKYTLPEEYDSAVTVDPPTYEFSTPYNNKIVIAAPELIVGSSAATQQSVNSSNSGGGTIGRVKGYSTGYIGVPEDEVIAKIHKNEIVVRAEHAPAVYGFMRDQGMLPGYQTGNVPSGVPSFATGWSGTMGSVSFGKTQTQSPSMNNTIIVQSSDSTVDEANPLPMNAKGVFTSFVDTLMRSGTKLVDFNKIFDSIAPDAISAVTDAQSAKRDAEIKYQRQLGDYFATNPMTVDDDHLLSGYASKSDNVRARQTLHHNANFQDMAFNWSVADFESKNDTSYIDTANIDKTSAEANYDKIYSDLFDSAMVAALRKSDEFKDIFNAIGGGMSKSEEMEKEISDTIQKYQEYSDKLRSNTDFQLLSAEKQQEILSKLTPDAAIKAIQDKYAAALQSAISDIDSYISGLSGEKSVTDELAAAHAEADAKIKEYAQKVVDAGGAVDLAAKLTEGYINVEKNFADQRAVIAQSANDRLNSLKGIADENAALNKAVSEEQAWWTEQIAKAQSKGAGLEELAALRDQEAEAIRLVTAATEDKIKADKEAALSKVSAPITSLQGNIGDFVAENIQGKSKAQIAFEKANNLAKDSMTVDDLTAYTAALADAYQTKFDTFQGALQGWQDLKSSTEEIITDLSTLDEVTPLMGSVPKLASQSVEGYTDYVNATKEFVDKLKSQRDAFASFQADIASARESIASDVSTAGLSTTDKISAGMASLTGLDPEKGLEKAKDLQSLVMSNYDEQKKAIDDQKSAIESQKDALEKVRDLVKSIQDKSDSLKYSDFNLSKGQERQTMAEQDYASLLAKAKTGDATAISDFTGFIDTYLKQSQDLYASSDKYVSIYNQVQADLAGLGNSTQAQAMSQEDALNAQIASLGGIESAAAQTNSYLDQLSAYAASQQALLDSKMTEQIDLLKGLTGAGGGITSGITASASDILGLQSGLGTILGLTDSAAEQAYSNGTADTSALIDTVSDMSTVLTEEISTAWDMTQQAVTSGNAQTNQVLQQLITASDTGNQTLKSLLQQLIALISEGGGNVNIVLDGNVVGQTSYKWLKNQVEHHVVLGLN